tara:strand:- start:32 stop:295 length:264 start_codon:yes stop_codon:yes gene_type:complete
MNWKYALIRVADDPETGESQEMVSELYLGKDGENLSYCPARINSMVELETAYKEILEDGLNEWFYNNGDFYYDLVSGYWEWVDTRYS